MSIKMAEQGEPLCIFETTIQYRDKPVKIMTLCPKMNAYDTFIDTILEERGWWGKKLSSIMMIIIDEYPICCYNNLNRQSNINDNNMWEYLSSIDAFSECFRSRFYDDTTDFMTEITTYSKQIAEIINKKIFGHKIGYGTISRVRDGYATQEYQGFGIISKDKWFKFDMISGASRIIFNTEYLEYAGSSTTITLYDYIQYNLNTNQHISIDINLYKRMTIWYTLCDQSNHSEHIDTIIRKGKLLEYELFEPESEPELELEPEPESD